MNVIMYLLAMKGNPMVTVINVIMYIIVKKITMVTVTMKAVMQ